MPKAGSGVADDALVQLGVRVPRPLYRRVRVHCVKAESQVRDFVAEAIAEKLARVVKRSRRTLVAPRRRRA